MQSRDVATIGLLTTTSISQCKNELKIYGQDSNIPSIYSSCHKVIHYFAVDMLSVKIVLT